MIIIDNYDYYVFLLHYDNYIDVSTISTIVSYWSSVNPNLAIPNWGTTLYGTLKIVGEWMGTVVLFEVFILFFF